MKKLLLYSFITASLFVSSQTIQAQTAPAKQWDKTIGGGTQDFFYTLIQTNDGSLILGGESYSGVSGDKSQASQGSSDYWIVKLDASGNKVWDKTYGGASSDAFRSLQQTTDGGFILGGYSRSSISGDKSQASKGGDDFWIVKIDANGIKQWDKTFGTSDHDIFRSLQQTSDGGYILGGSSSSGISFDKSQPSNGGVDFWIIKLDASGNKVWDKTYGGNSNDALHSIIKTTDGGYIVGGYSNSNISGNKTQDSKGLNDFWILKLDTNGNKTWDKTYGGNDQEYLGDIKQTADGGYILGGRSQSGISGDKTQASNGGFGDYWVVKLDATGNKVWDKGFGGNSSDQLNAIQETFDGGYILGGGSSSPISGDKSQTTKGAMDYWIVKLDLNGNKIWDKTLGGIEDDNIFSVHQTNNGSYIIGGLSGSNVNSDKSQPSRGEMDYWIVKLAPDATTGLPETQTTNFTLYPNPTTGLINLELKDQQPTQISIYNSLGQTILTQTEAQPNQDGKLQLDLSNQAKGIYTIQVISGKQSAVSKVVLQ